MKTLLFYLIILTSKNFYADQERGYNLIHKNKVYEGYTVRELKKDYFDYQSLQKCIGDNFTDYVCDSCYTKIYEK
jgi:hypothetical protein